MVILAIGLGATGLSHFLGQLMVGWITSLPAAWRLQDYSLTSGFFWIVVIATSIGLLLSAIDTLGSAALWLLLPGPLLGLLGLRPLLRRAA